MCAHKLRVDAGPDPGGGHGLSGQPAADFRLTQFSEIQLADAERFSGGPDQARAFVRRYGLLWHGPDKLGSDECRESLDDWWSAAEGLSAVLAMSVALGEAMREESADPIRRFFRERAGLQVNFGDSTDEAYIRAATTIVARLLNDGQQDGHLGFVTAGLGELQLAYYSTNLVAAAYANIGALVATKAEFKQCPGGGRIFQPESGRQKYHDRQCAIRARQRKWKREKSRDGQHPPDMSLEDWQQCGNSSERTGPYRVG